MSVICSYINWVINSALFLIFKFHIFLCLGTLSLLHLGLDDKIFFKSVISPFVQLREMLMKSS